MNDETSPAVRVFALGGLGEIGLNSMIVSAGKDAFFIDAGLMFPDDSMPGVDVVIPDMDVVLQQDLTIHGYVLTHGHEDHIGALPYALKKIPAPVFATGLTMGLGGEQTQRIRIAGLQRPGRLYQLKRPIDLGTISHRFSSQCATPLQMVWGWPLRPRPGC